MASDGEVVAVRDLVACAAAVLWVATVTVLMGLGVATLEVDAIAS